MRKKPEIDENEKDEFREAMRGVKPIAHTKVNADCRVGKAKRAHHSVPEDESQEIIFSDYEKLAPVDGEEFIEYAKSGIQHKVLRKLRSGQYNIEAILDLHGKNSEAAKKSLSDFLLACQERDLRHVLIIHGKGRDITKPILKNKLNHWLRQAEQVLAFCSATKHGRGGALYVLLKGR